MNTFEPGDGFWACDVQRDCVELPEVHDIILALVVLDEVVVALVPLVERALCVQVRRHVTEESHTLLQQVLDLLVQIWKKNFFTFVLLTSIWYSSHDSVLSFNFLKIVNKDS